MFAIHKASILFSIEISMMFLSSDSVKSGDIFTHSCSFLFFLSSTYFLLLFNKISNFLSFSFF